MSATSTAIAPLRMERTCRLIEWRPWSLPNQSLLGHCSVVFAGGWIVNQVPVFRKADGTLSVGVPSAAQIDADGRVKTRDGKRVYTAVLTFESAEGRARWQRSVIGALSDGGIGGAP